jgi:hypothetical protein
MQILIAVVVMGLIGVLAVVLVTAAALIRLLPLLLVVLVVVGAVRWWERRDRTRKPPWPAASARSLGLPPPAPPGRPMLPAPTVGCWFRCGWTLADDSNARRSLTPK